MVTRNSETESSPRLEAEVKALKADVANLRQDIAGLTEALRQAATDYVGEAGEKVHARAASARESVSKRAAGARERVSEQFDHAVGAGRKAVDDVGGKIGERPITSLLSAAGIGFIIAKLLDFGSRR